MAVLDLAVKQIVDKGWLSLTSLCFDNAYVINIFNTRGYVAYSKSQACFFCTGGLDSTDSESIESKFNAFDAGHVGMQQVITCVGEEHLQHFDMALYSQYRFVWDEQTVMPYPTIPTKTEIEALTPNPDTGLYDGYEQMEMYDGRLVSVIPMYKKFFNYPVDGQPFSGAKIDSWKQFYLNQKKFMVMLKDGFGITDAI